MATEKEREMIELMLEMMKSMEKQVKELRGSVTEFRNEFKEFRTETRGFHSEFLNRQAKIGKSLDDIIELNRNRKSAKEIFESIAGKDSK